MAMSADATADSLRYYFTADSVSSRPATWEVALHTGAPGLNGEDNEVADSAYARQSGAFAVDVTDPDAPFADNTGLITYPAAVAAYTVTHISIHATGGDCLAVLRLVVDKAIDVGVQAQFAVGEIILGGTPQ